ncbi:MAG: DUF4349 domain-containing protein [Armatimonadetes bacterium]|nr:DUF4349 domain-containing protein [Armatimonadota bacterium]
MMTAARLATVLAVLGFLAGCGRSDMERSEVAGADSAKQAAQMPAARMAMGGPPAAPGESAAGSPAARLPELQAASSDRYLRREGTITLEADDVRKAAAEVTASATQAGGYVADGSEATDPIQGVAVTLLIRVPATRFDGITSQVTALGRLIEKHVSAQDVTEEYVDSDSRVRNLKRTEERLLAHLGRTGKLADTLAIERELTRVREEIEQTSGRLRFLSHRIAFCTLTVTLRETARRRPVEPAESWSSRQVASDAGRSLVGFARSIWSMVIWVAIWSPVWALLVGLVVWLVRRGRRPAP